MDVLSVDVGRHYEGVFALEEARGKLISDLVCFLRRYLSGLE
jgi:hypothetical protein